MFQRANVFALELSRRLTSLEQQGQALAESAATVRNADKRLQSLEHGLRQANLALQEDVSRLTAALEVVRGQVVGVRGGRPRNETLEADRQALEVGRRVLQAAASPEGRAQLVLELQQAGHGPTVDALGNPIRPPQVRNGSPV